MLVFFTQAIEGRFAITRNEKERRLVLRELVRIAGPGLLAFCLVDDHLHTGLRVERPPLIVRELRRMLRRVRPDLELLPAHIKPIESRGHLLGKLKYMLEQSVHHQLAGVHPALHGGSCFQDLITVRLLPGFSAGPLMSELPRLGHGELFPVVGLDPTPIEPALDDDLRRLGPAGIASLAAEVFAVGPGFQGRTPLVVRARTLAVRLLIRLEFGTAEAARSLRISQRQAQRLASEGTPDLRGEWALRRRLMLTIRVTGRIASA